MIAALLSMHLRNVPPLTVRKILEGSTARLIVWGINKIVVSYEVPTSAPRVIRRQIAIYRSSEQVAHMLDVDMSIAHLFLTERNEEFWRYINGLGTVSFELRADQKKEGPIL